MRLLPSELRMELHESFQKGIATPVVAVKEASREELLRTTRELIDVYRARVKKNPRNFEDYILLGQLFRIQGQPKRALRIHLNTLASPVLDREQEIALYTELGYDLLETKAHDFGERYFLKALSLRKNNTRALEGLTRTYEMLKEYDKAVDVLSKLVRLGKEKKTHLAYVLSTLAADFLSNNLVAKARRHIDKAIRADENCPYALLVLSDVYAEAGRFPRSIQALKTFLLRWPMLSFLALRKLEDVHYRMNDFPGYETTLHECLRNSPDNFYLHFSMARHLRKKRRYKEALEYVRRCLDINPMYINAVRDFVELNSDEELDSKVTVMLKRFFEAFKRSRRFICPNCRHRYSAVTWHCKACGVWDTFDIRYELPAP